MTAKEAAEALRDEIVRSARRRNAEHNDIPDKGQFESFMHVVEEIGLVTVRAAAAGMSQDLVGRALKYYAKCAEEQYARR